MSGGDGWIMVKSRGDESEGRRLRVLRRHKGADEANVSDVVSSLQAEDTESADTVTGGYQSLVGAPIRMPQRELHSDFTISSKVGGSLRLDQCSLVTPCSAELTVISQPPPSVSHLDLSDTTQWPGMGRQEDVIPQLGSWSTVVKKPVLPKLQKKDHELETDAIKADEPTKEGRKSKKKKTTEREPFMLELGSLFEALEVKESKKLVLGTGGGAAISQRPKNLANVNPTKAELVRTGNPMDSSAPSTRRGKEREVPKTRKPSALRKVIIKEKLARADPDMAEMSEASRKNSGRLGMNSDMQSDRVSRPPSLHSRKFREYCDHMLTEEINREVEKLLNSLRFFQDRQYLKDPTKSKAKRRYVCGLREVLKHLKLRKLKFVIVPPNLDRVESEGGINEFVEQILELCHEQAVPYIFAMTRRRLACVLRKKHRIGCVGIFYYDGAEEHYKKIMELAETARQEYSGHIAAAQPTKDLDNSGTGAAHTGKSSLTEACSSSVGSESDDDAEMSKCTLNISASEFVPAFNFALNVDAAVFTPSFLPTQNFCAT